MARQDVFIKIQIKGAAQSKKEIDGVSDASRKLSKEQILLKKGYDNLNKSEKEYLVSLEQERIALQNTKFQVSKLAFEKNKASKASGNFRAQAGLNNAILLESGRLASDLSFGFTAIANNLSQLVSLFGSFIATTGGIGSSFKQLGKSLLGTGGVLLAIQLFIAALQSKRVAEFVKSLSVMSKELLIIRGLLDATGKNAESLVGSFRIYTSILKDANESQQQKRVALQKLNKEYPDFNANILTEAGNTREAARAIDEYVESLRRKALSQAAEEEFKKISGAIVKIELERETELANAREKFFKRLATEEIGYVQTTQGASEAVIVSQEAKTVAYVENANTINELADKEIAKEEEKLDILIKLIDLYSDKIKGSGNKRTRLFRQQLLDLSRLILNFNRQEEELTVQNDQQKLDLQERFAKEDIARRQRVFEERQRQRFEDFKASTKNAKLIKDAEDKLNESLRKSREEAREATVAVEGAFSTKRILLADKEGKAVAKILRDTENAEINRLKSRTDLDTMFFDKKAAQIQGDIELNKGRLMNEKLTELQRQQITKETFDLQEKLRQNDLQKELAVINAKKSIQTEYMSWTAGVATFLKTIAGENEELAKAGIVLEKGAAIADVIIKANASKAVNLAQATAVAPPPKNAPFIIAAQAQNRRTDVSSAIAIANILATSLFGGKKSVGGGGRGGSGSVRVEAPDFNVVGASPEDRLGRVVREELGGQQQQTVRAVVSLNDLDIAQSTRENINRNNSLD
jgi:hypothetical protein